MHSTSLKNMTTCYEKYILGEFLEKKESVLVLDVGSMNINGSYRQIFKDGKIKYTGIDLVGGNGVDIVLKDPYHYPFDSGSFDIVVSGQTFEHCEFFWDAFVEMSRVLKIKGYLFLITPSSGPVHRCPVDCYRFYSDSYNALAKYAKIRLIDKWIDKNSKWCDLVGVFQKI